VPIAVPTELDDVLAHLGAEPTALLLQGGTDVMVEINMHHRQPAESVIALRRVAALRSWVHDPHQGDHDNGVITIGSGVPYAEMEHGPLGRLLPALAEAARTVGSPQIRAAGTIGGNLGTCSPAGDSLPVLFALDAIVHLRSLDGQRDVPVGEFMVGVKRNVLQPGELITGVTVPVLQGWQGYSKVGVRNAMVIATASACLASDPERDQVRLALGAVGTTIIRCRETEDWLAGEVDLGREEPDISDDVAAEFGRRAGAEARPIDDHRSTAAYRRHAIGVLATRLLKRAFA
jgi:CO/xanthine dehydrogenase FAD-binding subunit